MSQIQTDAGSGDLVFEGGSLVRIEGVDEIAQHIRVRLRLLRGEVPERQDLGMPVFDDLLIKGAAYDLITQAIRDTIQGTPGVVSVDAVDLGELDSATRTLPVSFSATVSLGDLAQRLPLHDSITVQLQGVE
jgi:hypothetical protein